MEIKPWSTIQDGVLTRTARLTACIKVARTGFQPWINYTGWSVDPDCAPDSLYNGGTDRIN